MIDYKPAIISLISFLLAGSACPSLAAENGIPWADSIATAQNLAASSDKLVLIHFCSTNCPPCVRLERKVFSQPVVSHTISQQFVPIKVNVDHFPEIAKQFGIDRWPSDVLMTPQGAVLHRQTSPSDGTDYLNMIRQVAWRHANGTQLQPPSLASNPQSGQPISQQSFSQQPQASGTYSNVTTANMANPPARPQADQTFRPEPAHNGGSLMNHQPAPQAPGPSFPVQPAVPYGTIAPRGPATQSAANTTPQMITNRYYDNGAATHPARAAYPGPSAATQRPYTPSPKMIHNNFSAGAQPQMRANGPPAASGMPPAQPYGATPTATNQMQPAATAPATAAQQVPPNVNQRPAANAAALAGMQNAIGPPAAPAGSPPTKLGLDGFCPVTLMETDKWESGDKRWGVRHRGRVYLFASPAAQESFLAEPDRYCPALAGYDPVVFNSNGEFVDGTRNYGVRYFDQIFLFSSEESLQQFWKNPSQFVEPVRQAMAGTTLR